MNQNGYQQYKTQSINTMTKAEMLILLYDELIKRLIRAEIALKNDARVINVKDKGYGNALIEGTKQAKRKVYNYGR